METQRFLQPNPPLSMEDIVARENIKELITYERFCRDNSLWDGMRTCFTSDSEVTISWFKGTGDEFVAHSQAMQRYAPHQIYNIQVWQNSARAIAVMQATIQSRLDIESETYELQSDAKIIYRIVKQEETWRIQHLDCVYEQDRLCRSFLHHQPLIIVHSRPIAKVMLACRIVSIISVTTSIIS